MLAAYLPLGVAFGAAHALTPGHSKTVLALFVAGSGSDMSRAIGSAIVLAATHIAVSVLVVVLALPLVSLAFGEVGRAQVLEDVSRGLLGVVGLWLLFAATRGHSARKHHEGAAFGFFAGLIPCPLTLFVMTFASARGVPEAGLAFAAMMLIGVAAVLTSVAAVAVFARAGLGQLVGAQCRDPGFIHPRCARVDRRGSCPDRAPAAVRSVTTRAAEALRSCGSCRAARRGRSAWPIVRPPAPKPG